MKSIFIFLAVLSYLIPRLYLDSSLTELQSDDPIVFHENQFFVSLADEIVEDTLDAYLTEFNAVEVWSSGSLDMALWEVDSFPFTIGMDSIFDINGVVARSKRKTKITNAALNIQQEIIFSSTQISTCFDLSALYKEQGDSSNITISILDTGIGNIADNSTGDFNYNLLSYTGYDYVNNDGVPEDENGHGSHIAGLIHSITHQSNPANNRIFFDIRKTHDAEGKAFMSAVVIGLLDAIDAGADIVNMSFGYRDIYSDTLFYPLKVAIEDAVYRDVLVIAAAGNDQLNNDNNANTALPASFPIQEMLTVTSLSCDGSISNFGNFGATSVDVAIMGEGIPGPDLGTGITYMSGTSQATAMISALAALKGTYYHKFKPLKIICPVLQAANHTIELGDQVFSNGSLDVAHFFSIQDTTCLVNNFDCNTDFSGAGALTGVVDSSLMLETNLTIQTSQILQINTETTYDGMQVELQEGFEMQAGAKLYVKTTGCEN